jgi:acetyltransferase-like isoleucine patch superfamily enzyme
MGQYSTIGAFTVCKGIALLEIGEYGHVGRLNLITGFPLGKSRHFSLQSDRKPQLVIGRHAAITNQHVIDCTDAVTIGAFSTFAGFRSQILTHSIDLAENMQKCAPVTIGDYAFVGTDTVILGGSTLPSRSILAAKSLLNKRYEVEGYLYGGTPARPIAPCAADAKYFTRAEGFVW